MGKYYAQLNEEKICIGVSQLTGSTGSPLLIAIPYMNTLLLGMKYNEGVWEDVEQPEPTLTDIEQLMQANTDAELRDLEIQQNQELLAQQMADIELALLGGGLS